MNKEEKKAVEYLKIRLYGNEGCKYIDVAQEDLRIFINLIDRLQKENECYKEQIEKLQKENEELKRLMAHKNGYTKLLEEDLFENCSNYVIPTQTIKGKIEELKENGYWNYLEERDLETTIGILQELLEGRK